MNQCFVDSAGDRKPSYGRRGGAATGLMMLVLLLTAGTTAPAGLIVSSTNLDFGKVLIGGQKDLGDSAKNTDNATRTVSFGTAGSGLGAAASASFSRSGNASTAVAKNASASSTYRFAPTTRGSAASSAAVSYDGTAATKSVNVALKGQGVAPVNRVTSTNAAATRIGTSSMATMTVKNIGDGNQDTSGASVAATNLNGTASHGSGDFSLVGNNDLLSLADGASKTFQYAFSPTTHGTESAVVGATFSNGSDAGDNSAQAKAVTLTGKGVGPTYHTAAAPGSTLDFGTVYSDTMATQFFSMSNATNDPGSLALTGLTILSVTFTGNAGFSVTGFSPNTVLAAHKSDTMYLHFSAIHQGRGEKSGTLTIVTDENAAFGHSGKSFSYDLHATVVPEPSTFGMMGTASAILGSLAWRRRRGPVISS